MSNVRFENVTKKYGKVFALNDVSFECMEGEFFTLLGPSGAGKTTTLEIIAGLKKIDSGSVYFNGEDVKDVPTQLRDVAMAFENYALYSHLNVYNNIAFPLRSPQRKVKLSAAQEREQVEFIANRLGIGEYLERMPKQLSGGQKQRVSLARAMVRRPQVFLLDEPIAHLDAKLRALARSDLKKIAREVGTTIIYVTHNYREALALSDRILIMRTGKVEQIGTPEEIYNTPATDFVANLVGDPPINLLDGELKEADGKLSFSSLEFSFNLPERDYEAAKKAAWESEGKRMIRLGFRPDCISLSTEKSAENAVKMPILVSERKDESYIYKFSLKNNLLIVDAAKHEIFAEQDEVWVNLELDKAHYFTKTFELS